MKLPIPRKIKNIIKRLYFIFYKLFSRLGVHILPVHYYSPLANIIELEASPELWKRKSKLPGLAMNLSKQINTLETICLPYQSEYVGNYAYNYAKNKKIGPGYGYIEAQALHAVIRKYKPKRIVEVGCGVSTWCMLQAQKRNREETCIDYKITCIEPFPTKNFQQLENVELVIAQVQTQNFNDRFASLNSGDFLFIDSSHSVKPGSDVNYLILEILPLLASGVIVHFHDINLPFDYPPDTLKSFYHGMETSLLHAYLIHNNKIEVLFCLSQIHYEATSALVRVFPDYRPALYSDGLIPGDVRAFDSTNTRHFPSSIYLQIL